jgi:hypothetical protein
VIKEQESQVREEQQMGESVNIDVTPIGIIIHGVYWRAPTNDLTIPLTQADINGCANELVAAMRNNQGCREMPTTGEFQRKWAAGATYYSDTVPKTKAYNLMVSTPHFTNLFPLTQTLVTHDERTPKRLDQDDP